MSHKQSFQCPSDLSDDNIIDHYQKIAQNERNIFMKKLHTFFTKDKYFPNSEIETHEREIKIYQEFKYFEKTHRDWFYYHLEDGFPTFYSILGVNKHVDMKRLDENYIFKRQNSYLPLEIIEEAYKTIKKVELRKNYNRFLKMLQNYYPLLEEEEKIEINKKHSEWQYFERAKTMLSLIVERHQNWEVLYLIGLNLFTIAKLTPEFNYSDIITLHKKYLKSRAKYAKIQVLITKLFLNPFVFKEYKIFLSLFPLNFLDDEKNRVIAKLQRHWSKFNFTINDFGEVLLSDESLREKLVNYQSIIIKNNNWIEYLPPHKNTFYNILNIDINNLNSINEMESNIKSSEFRELLFKKYKIAEKTSETNLAYSVLKNPQTRTDYDWLLKNNLIFMKFLFLIQIEYLDSMYLNKIIKEQQNIEDILIQDKFLRF